MSECLQFYQKEEQLIAVATKYNVADIIIDWNSLRRNMIREKAQGFNREEWAYLITFLEHCKLKAIVKDAFGKELVADEQLRPAYIVRSRGSIALWLPNNVSLLGPLSLVLLSLSGSPLQIKSGNRSENLTESFFDFALKHLSSETALYKYLSRDVQLNFFTHDDPRNAAMAAGARTRIFFGSDLGAAAVERMPHPLDSQCFMFTDRQSEIWLEYSVVDNDLIAEIIKVFAVYGRMGCTSPQRIVILGGSENQADQLREKIAQQWSSVIKSSPLAHVASEVFLAKQWARALGWKVSVAGKSSALLASGSVNLETPSANMFLPIIASNLQQCLDSLPSNIQTVGHALSTSTIQKYLPLIATTPLKRFVPVRQMHHFGAIWDGFEFWRCLFEFVEYRQ